MNLFDSSALLCFLLGEPGADTVEEHLDSEAACSAANWSEVCQKTLGHQRDWRAARALLLGFGLRIEPVTKADAERAAGLWLANPQLSLGDRLCLATGDRLTATVWTTDTAWGTEAPVRQLRG